MSVKERKIYSPKDIENMSYVDFVGFINQWNVLPGAYNTLTKWEIFSKINKGSNILEIACTTGFSSREIALSSKCKGKAFDLSMVAVKSAKENKKLYAKNINIEYFSGDGYKFKTKERFSHIIVGASLKFFPDPSRMLNICINLLSDGGFILASPFFIKKSIPQNLIHRFAKVFGIKPTIGSYKDIMSMYKGLEIVYQEKIDSIPIETEEELAHYCTSTIERACESRNIKRKAMHDAMYHRLYEIKSMSNALRPYQGYIVLVLRYRSPIYPNRYVELF